MWIQLFFGDGKRFTHFQLNWMFHRAEKNRLYRNLFYALFWQVTYRMKKLFFKHKMCVRKIRNGVFRHWLMRFMTLFDVECKQFLDYFAACAKISLSYEIHLWLYLSGRRTIMSLSLILIVAYIFFEILKSTSAFYLSQVWYALLNEKRNPLDISHKSNNCLHSMLKNCHTTHHLVVMYLIFDVV